MKEIGFYNKNKDNNFIPKLLFYDVSKEVVPYYFEIDRENTLKVFESVGFRVVEKQTWVKFGKIVKGVLVKKDL